MTDLAHGEQLSASAGRPAYGDGQLTYEPKAEVEECLDGRTHLVLAVAIFTPVVAAYGALAYGLYYVAALTF